MQNVYVLTVVKNSNHMITETIESVRNQTVNRNGKALVNHIVIDGGSTDGTRETLRKMKDITLIEREDNGLYDSLSYGISLCSELSGITCYLNSGDIWHERALEIVLEIFAKNESVNWLTGYRTSISSEGYIIYAQKSIFYSRKLISHGFYFSKLPAIQQESTFWRTTLNLQLNLEELSKLKLAGDYFIWKSFAKENKLYVVNAFLGAFRIHDHQLSDDRDGYLSEMSKYIEKNFVLRILIVPFRIMMKRESMFTKLIQCRRTFSYSTDSKDWVLLSSKIKKRLSFLRKELQ